MNEKFYKRTWFIVFFCIIFPLAGIALMWISRKPIRKNIRAILSVFLCLWTFALTSRENEDETKNNTDTIAEYEESETGNEEVYHQDSQNGKYANESGFQDEKESKESDLRENEKKKDGSKKKEKKKKKTKKDTEKSPFPNEDKYIVNNSLIRYNEFAKYPIDKDFISDLKEISRPLGRACVTASNGVYFIISYNDFNESVFVDYQEETSDDSGLFFVVRDMTKAVNPDIKDGDFEKIWEGFKSGTYFNHYDNSFLVKDFEFSFATRVVNAGKTEYSIKSRYYINGKQE